MNHPRAIAARMSNSPKAAARASGLTANAVRAIRDLQVARRENGRWIDPLVRAAQTRPWRRPSVLQATAEHFAARRAEAEALAAAREAKEAALAADLARAEAARKALLRAARVARALGFHVRASRDRAGRVSSYYATLRDGPRVRISDHLIPANERRDAIAFERGQSWGYDGYHGPEIIVDRDRSAIWLRRALTLAAAGRSPK